MKPEPLPQTTFRLLQQRGSMTRGELWTAAYRARRYLSHLSLDDLAKRSQDVMTNITTLTPEGQLGMHNPADQTSFPWMMMWANVIDELSARGLGIPPNALDRDTIPQPTFPIPAKGFRESRSSNRDLSKCLVKYGNRSWLEATIRTGEWRISPASYYSNDDLDKARQDSELEFHVCAADLEQTSVPAKGLENEYNHTLRGTVAVDVKAATDYYLVSLARGFIYRMFDDFKSDACLIIHDDREFARRMLNAFSATQQSWHGTFKAVEYLDPCVVPRSAVDVYFNKHFRYSYQQESRFVWTPRRTEPKLPQLTITLGPLNDICELVSLVDGSDQAADPGLCD